MLRDVVFDLGNVLISFDTADLLRRIVTDPADRPLVLQEVFRSIEWVMLDRGSIGAEEAITRMSFRLPARLGPEVREIVLNWQDNMVQFPDMLDLVRDLKEAGCRLWLLSNISRNFRAFGHRIEALRYFDGIYISAEHLLLKPDPAIFRDAASTYGIRPEDAVFIDDYPPNVEGAIHCGFQGLVFTGDSNRLRRELGRLGVALNDRK